MAFANISLDLQQIYLQDFSNFAKWFVFLIMISLSCLYLFYLWKKQDKTIFVTTAIWRSILYVLSISCILTTPYLILLMSPEYSFWQFMVLPLTLYSIFFIILTLTAFIDLLRYGIPVLLRFGNLDMKDPNVDELMNKFENNKHFLK